MSIQVEIVESLRQHLALCEEVLTIVQREKKLWQDPQAPASLELYQTKKALLPRLQQSVDHIRACRMAWQRMTPEERAQTPEIGSLLEQNQNLILKIVVLDRENEQVLLRRGLGSTPQRTVPTRQQQPHFVAELYRRNRF